MMTTPTKPNIEFMVVATEDLYLEGTTGRLLRVSKDYAYSCQMQRDQPMSCLFKHYAKHQGLRKEDLTFSFVDRLEHEDSPESVRLLPNDKIFVSKRSNDESLKSQLVLSKFSWSQSMLKMLRNPCHSDITFIVGKEKTKIACHKAIVCARSEYFTTMFQPGGLYESRQTEVVISHYSSKSFMYMLEHLYTGDFPSSIHNANIEDLENVVMMADEYNLDILKKFAGKNLCSYLKEDNIVNFIVLAKKHNISNLQEACIQFLRMNKSALKKNPNFIAEMENAPEVGLMLFSALPSFSLDSGYSAERSEQAGGPNKRLRAVLL